MSIKVPIVVEYFGGRAINKAIREFKSLKTSGERTAFALKTAFKGAAFAAAGIAAAAAGAAAAMWNFAKAAAEDQTSAAILARQLKVTTKATDEQVKSVEDWITKLQLFSGVADNELRPNLGKLVRATKSVTKAQKLLQLGLDISSATGRDLDSVVTSLVRAYMGNLGGLTRLGISLDKSTIKSKDFKKAQEELGKQFGGATFARASTFQGTMDRLSQAFSEIKEKIGYALLPLFEKLAAIAGKVADAFGKKGAAGAVQALKEGFMGLFYDPKTGVINAAGQQVNQLIEAANKLKAAGLTGFGVGAGATTGAAIGSVIPGVGTVAGAVIGGTVGGLTGFGASKVIGIPSLPRVNPNAPITGADTGNRFVPKSDITINVYNGDPKEVIRAIKDFNRQNGRLLARTGNLGSS